MQGCERSRAGIPAACVTSLDPIMATLSPAWRNWLPAYHFLNPAQISLWRFPCRFCSLLGAREAQELFSIIGRAGSSVREDVLQPCQDESRRCPLKGIQGTAPPWVWSWCSLSTGKRYANVKANILAHCSQLLLATRWVRPSGWARWKAEPCKEGAWGFARPSPIFLHAQMVVFAAAIKMEGYIPPAKADLPPGSSVL